MQNFPTTITLMLIQGHDFNPYFYVNNCRSIRIPIPILHTVLHNNNSFLKYIMAKKLPKKYDNMTI